jgi:hemoglobin
METAHTGLNITEENWTIAVKALGHTLNKFKVASREQGEVVSAIVSLKGKIVGR